MRTWRCYTIQYNSSVLIHCYTNTIDVTKERWCQPEYKTNRNFNNASLRGHIQSVWSCVV